MGEKVKAEKSLVDTAKCEQCGEPLGAEVFLGPVCGKCCRANHRKATGRGRRKARKGGRG